MAADPRLIRALDRRDPVPAAELLRALAVSPPTLSRMVAAAGEEVARLGKARATRYARTRLVEGVGRSAPLFRVRESGEPALVGRAVFLHGGGTWWEDERGGTLFVGLPPPLADMAPQGYLGRGFPARYPELGLPAHVPHWTDDHRLSALARRGEDTVGDLILGNESLTRFLAAPVESVRLEDYPTLAERSAVVATGSSAGGERPKFGAFTEGRHVIVKFAPPGDDPIARRWRALLRCEDRAARVVAAAGLPAVEARCVDVEGWRFLEVARFDRVGERGRLGLVSLEALDSEYFGVKDSWSAAAVRLRESPFLLSEDDAARLRWLDAFGQMIGNTDRHFGNVSFFTHPDGRLRLAPAYDMLPMLFAPSAETLVEREYVPQPPQAETLEEWRRAAPWAVRYWRGVEADGTIEDAVRQRARSAAEALEALVRRVAPSLELRRAPNAG